MINPDPQLSIHQNHRGKEVTDDDNGENSINSSENQQTSYFPIKLRKDAKEKVQSTRIAGAVNNKIVGFETGNEKKRLDQESSQVTMLSSDKKDEAYQKISFFKTGKKQFNTEHGETSGLKSHVKVFGEGNEPRMDGVIGNQKVFDDKAALEIRESNFTGKEPFQCQMYRKTFKYSSKLITHERTHLDERPYNCPLCDKSFKQSHHLVSHKRTHTGERPYKCSLCDKSFKLSHHLVRHKRTHTG